MSLQALLQAGAERIATAYMATIPWRQNSQGQWNRRPISQRDRTTILQRLEHLFERPLLAPERSALNQLVDAAEHATRLAHRTATPGRSLPRPNEVQRLPGAGNRGGNNYYYRTVVNYIDPQTGQQGKVTHTVVSNRVLSGDEVHARVVQAMSSGQIIPDQGTDDYAAAGRLVRSVDIIALYLGALHI